MVKLNANDVVPQIAVLLEKLSGESAQKLISDHHLLDQCIYEHRKGFPWDQLARSLNVSKQQIYRWYFDNYQRHLHGGVEKADMEIIRREVSIAIKNCTKITKEMYTIIKTKLSKSYHRNAFTIAFNNAKNTISKLFGQQQQRRKAALNYQQSIAAVYLPPVSKIPKIPTLDTISNTDHALSEMSIDFEWSM